MLLVFGFVHARVRPDLGKSECDSNCAGRDGLSGKGDGSFAKWAGIRMPDLTQTGRSNGGVLPVRRLGEIIDGRAIVGAHGRREMPIWGLEYTLKARPADDEYRHDPEVFVHTRIVTSINCSYRLQVK